MDHDRVERAEGELSWAGLAVGETIRVAELAVIAIGALLICPPLAILAVVVIVPAIAVAVVVGAVATVIALPVFAVRHLHRHRSENPHAHVHRLARLGRTDADEAVSWLRRVAGRVRAKLYRTQATPR